MKCEKGFLLTEAVVVILILAIGFTAFVGVLSQALKVSSRAQRLTEALLQFENLLFQLETGERVDLIDYGGQGRLMENYRYQIQTKEKEKGLYQVKNILAWRQGREAVQYEGFYLSEADL